nr:hypothetical protein [Cellulomonas chengniuliangii]
MRLPARISLNHAAAPAGSGSRPSTSRYAFVTRDEMYSSLRVNVFTNADWLVPDINDAVHPANPVGSGPRPNKS